MTKKLHVIKWENNEKHIVAITVVLTVAIVGSSLLLFSHAATPNASIEAESGTVTGAATTSNNNNASGGQYITFGSNSTTNNRAVALGFDVAFDHATTTPWNDITQDALFAIQTTNGSALDTTDEGLSTISVPQWVTTVHAHNVLAIITIGGIADQNWENACNNTNRSAFVTNVINYMINNGFDGVDLDIEDDTWSAQGPPSTAMTTCAEALATAAHAAKTAAGKTPIVSEDVTTPWMGSWVAPFQSYIDQINLMTYGDSCANNCSTFASEVQSTINEGVTEKNKFVLGIDNIDGTSHQIYQSLATTNATVNTGNTVSSITLASGLSAEIPAGNIVLATAENPPIHYEILTTTGATQGAMNIPITREVTGNGTFAFLAGSQIQNDYIGPWDCGNTAKYAAQQGFAGAMIWDIHEDGVLHNGSFPCFDQMASP